MIVDQIMYFIKNNRKNQRIEMCSNVKFFKQTILIAQDVIHKYVSDQCIKIINNMKTSENGHRDGNDDQKDENKNDENNENDGNDDSMQPNQSQSQPSQSQSQQENS